MSSSMQSRLLEHYHLLKFQNRSKNAKHKRSRHEKVTKITFSLIIAALSSLAVGCNTLQALEPTAILISNIKHSI